VPGDPGEWPFLFTKQALAVTVLHLEGAGDHDLPALIHGSLNLEAG
jgi:hypothetical protein